MNKNDNNKWLQKKQQQQQNKQTETERNTYILIFESHK